MKTLIKINILQLPFITKFYLDEKILFLGLLAEAVYDDGSHVSIENPYLEYPQPNEVGEYECKIYLNENEKDVYASFNFQIYTNLEELIASTPMPIAGCTTLARRNNEGCSTTAIQIYIPCTSSSDRGCGCSSTSVCSTSTSTSTCSCISSSDSGCGCSSTQTCSTSSSRGTCSCSSSSDRGCGCSDYNDCTTSSDEGGCSCSSSSDRGCGCSSSQTCSCTASGLSSCVTCPSSGSATTKDINIEIKDTLGRLSQVENVTSLNFDGSSKTVGIEYYRSNNYNKTSSTAEMTSNNVALNSGDKITIDYYVLSESSYDKLNIYIYKDGSQVDSVSDSGYNSGWSTKTYNVTSSGSYSIKVQYVKDSSNNSGADRAWIRRPYYNINGVNYLFEFTNTGNYGFDKLRYQKI